jgi:hypothetical protein
LKVEGWWGSHFGFAPGILGSIGLKTAEIWLFLGSVWLCFSEKPNKDGHSLASFFQKNFFGKSQADKPTAETQTLSLICQQTEGRIGRATDAKRKHGGLKGDG